VQFCPPEDLSLEHHPPSLSPVLPPTLDPGGTVFLEGRSGGFVMTGCNGLFETHFGLEAGAGSREAELTSLLPGDVGRDMVRCCNEALAKRGPICRRMTVGGGDSERCVLLGLSPEPAAGDAPDRVRGVSIDVTTQARAESAISSSEGFDRYLIHATDRFAEPVLICDASAADPVVVYSNKAFHRVFGYARSEVVGRDPVYLMFPEAVVAIHEVIESSNTNQRPVWKIASATRKDGGQVRCKTVFEFHRAEQSPPSQLKITFIVLEGDAPATSSEAGPGQYRRLQLQGMLQAAGSIINDFNNLLAVIIGNAPLLPAQVQDNLEAIKTSKRFATQAADLVINLLRMTRRLRPAPSLEAGAAAAAPPPEPSSIERAIQAAPMMDTLRAARELARPGPDVPVAGASVFAGVRPPAPPSFVPPPEPSGDPPRVLIVDDEPFIRSMIDRSLSLVGYRTVQAASGEEALGLLEKNKTGFDVVIMDYTLGGLSGLEVVQIMRRHELHTPVLMISGYLGPEVTEQTLAQGRVRVLTKPFHPNELIESVESMARSLS
jgi:PAS domain S-box-containing protein